VLGKKKDMVGPGPWGGTREKRGGGRAYLDEESEIHTRKNIFSSLLFNRGRTRKDC